MAVSRVSFGLGQVDEEERVCGRRHCCRKKKCCPSILTFFILGNFLYIAYLITLVVLETDGNFYDPRGLLWCAIQAFVGYYITLLFKIYAGIGWLRRRTRTSYIPYYRWSLTSNFTGISI